LSTVITHRGSASPRSIILRYPRTLPTRSRLGHCRS
jgi:hypothetical protein